MKQANKHKDIIRYLEWGEIVEKSKTYQKVIKHRQRCKSWNMARPEACINCWGGGLHKFVSDLMIELNDGIRSYKNATAK